MAKGETKTTTSSEETVSRRKKDNNNLKSNKEILFSKDNYMIMGLGLAIVIIGFFLMSGGTNAPEEWKAEEIYSFTRITLAPIVILGGLVVVVFAIFKSSGNSDVKNLVD